METITVGNDQVDRVLMGVPKDHAHVRTVIEIGDTRLILQEATIAGIVRAFTTLNTHPTLRGIELVQRKCEHRKEGFAAHQLLASDKPSEDVCIEIRAILRNTQRAPGQS